MSKQTTKALVPVLRFPEFIGADEWKEKPLNKISKITMGSSPKSSAYNENGVGLPLLQGNADIKNRLSTPRVFTSQITKECDIGDILLSVRAPVGTVAKSNHNACIGRGLSAIRAFNDNCQEFIYQWLLYFEPFWDDISQGGTFDAVNSDDIRKLLAPVPEKDEQKKVSDCLSSLDELIAAHTKKHEALHLHKKGLMLNLFPAQGETIPVLRFPEFYNTGNWNADVFSNLVEIIDGDRGKNYPKAGEFSDSGHCLFLSAKNVTKNGFIFEEMLFISREKDNSLRKGKLKRDDVVLTTRGSVGQFAHFSSDVPYNDIRINSGMVLLRAKSKRISQDFLYTYCKAEVISKYIDNTAFGNAQQQLTVAGIKQFPLIYPSIEEQQKVADCLSSIEDLIVSQDKKIKELKSHKKGLMQQLFPAVGGVGA